MHKIDIRLDQAIFDLLIKQADDAGVPLSLYCRDLLIQAVDDEQRQAGASCDDMLGTSIQILSILATYVGTEIPEVLEQGLKEARTILMERGLLADGDPK
ncbi:hypothetical protein [Novosphingobium rosa]|uniref:hypothetical protein n=1 Tax=Novosphingobium rosa TaxID=76978 RepID=UPI00082EA28D|nr:hypothetical protein [Novosphingobium rosa]